MPALDWTSLGFIVALAAAGVILIVLGILFYYLPAARIKGLALLVGIGGGLGAGTALGLYLVRSAPGASSDKPSEAAAEAPLPSISNPASSTARAAQDALERFRKATPAQRMAQLQRLPDAAAVWHT